MTSNPTIDNELRVALVTGSTSGIGAAIARVLSLAGYAVVLHSRNSADTGRAMAAEMKQAIYVQADLAIEADRVRLVNEAIAAWGQLDVLVNNAGISRVIPHGDLASASSQVWHELNEVNVVAPFHLVALAESALRDAARLRRAGCVVNISSHAGVRPKGASIPYAVSKAALNHMTRLLAASLGPDVRVNAVAPGLVDTPLTAGWAEAQELWRTRAPMRRAATRETGLAHKQRCLHRQSSGIARWSSCSRRGIRFRLSNLGAVNQKPSSTLVIPIMYQPIPSVVVGAPGVRQCFRSP